jgi:hypothetical protein
MTYDDVIVAVIESGDLHDRAPEEVFADRYGRRLRDLSPEHALSVMINADAAYAGMSDIAHDGRFGTALLRPTHEAHLTQGHAGAWLASYRAREGK